MGGHSPPAFRRAVRKGNGWYGFFVDLERAKSHLEALAGIERDEGCDAAIGRLELSITPLPGLGVDDALRHRDLGLDRLTLIPDTRSEDQLLRWIDATAETILPRVG